MEATEEVTQFSFRLPSLESDVTLNVPAHRTAEYAEALEKLGFDDARMKRLPADA